MARRILILAAVLITIVAAIFAWRWYHPRPEPGTLVLFGNVDLRQADLAFNNSERIAQVLAQEGDHVHKGQLLARLDTTRLQPQYEQAQAQASAQQATVDRLHHGSRPEEIAQARADLESAKAYDLYARQQYDRVKKLAYESAGGGVSQQDVDNAKATLDSADAKVAVNENALELELIGPRKEDIAQAEAQLRADQAQAAFAHQQLLDAELYAPIDGVIRSRLMEPGDMASPQRPVFSLAIMTPKWVRAYVAETDLGRVHPGESAIVTVDSFPNRRFDGWVGFISPMAEFTPKTVQTEELRTSLVYEVRIFVNDPDDDLRLGMPATVKLSGQWPTTMP
jgi:HlyD family secretion protein